MRNIMIALSALVLLAACETGTLPVQEGTDPPVVTPSTLEPYYRSAEGLTGDALKAELNAIIKGHTTLSYDNVWNALKDTDEDPQNADNVILLYTQESLAKNENGGDELQWNREHVWAKSQGDFGTSQGPGTDIHHLRPTRVWVNNSRGNLDFDNGGTDVTKNTWSAPGCKKDGDSWEPPNAVKGDVARMIFYMAVRYEGTDSYVDLELAEDIITGTEPLMGKLSVLKQWHADDPVSDFEKNRNEKIYTNWQHNRNPFIDHPEWVEEIW